MLTLPNSAHHKQGFTLVETLVSVALLLLFFAALVSIYQIVIDLVGESRVRILATALASEKMEEIRNLSYDDIGTIGGIPTGVLEQSTSELVQGQTFVIETTVIYIDDPFDSQAPTDVISTDYKRIRVAVSWGGAFPSRSPVLMVTDAVPDGLETNVGGGTLIINSINSSGEAVTNADIHITNTSVSPNIDWNITTNNEGQIVIPGAPACNDCYEITVSKSGYTQDRTYSLSEIANPLKPHSGVIEGEVTALTFTIDPGATIVVRATRSQATGYAPFQGVEFTMRGTQLLGTNEFDEPIYKYDQNHVTGSGGQITLSSLSPDVYNMWLPDGSSIDIVATQPTLPVTVLPGQSQTVTIVTNAASAHSLLLAIQDINSLPIATATATLIGESGSIATGSAGPVGSYEHGQVYFGNLLEQTYSIYASQSGYLEASASTAVSGNTNLTITLEDE
jgi:prepilin-type N-terminal cleavage/methylation domain-containing protein